jgi:hypothetical protein
LRLRRETRPHPEEPAEAGVSKDGHSETACHAEILSTFLFARFRYSANQLLKTGKHAAAAPFSMA